MRVPGKSLAVLLLLVSNSIALAQTPDVGSETLIRLERETASKRPGGSSRSNSRNALVERVLYASGNAVELEYSLPASVEDRAGPSAWIFPIRVRKFATGEIEILNREELLVRRDNWLEEAPQFRRVCGQTIFSWTAVQIHCEVEDALEIIAPFDLWFWDIASGQMWREPDAISPQPLVLVENATQGQQYEVTLELDPQALRRAEAEAKVSVATMTGRPTPKLERVLQELDGVSYDGTLILGFQTDGEGSVTQRTWRRDINKTDGLGRTTSRLVTTTIKRSPMP